ncbi:hypothetical protein [Rhodococcus qingshengii]|uniref:hypothetical protein n=1 Tax=Rhodococcus qingshengii TaxID=334542 RepID=UPI001ADF22DB|nr:hypothetical protein [Rhodococcus qingshengii]MCQ4148706.1 hypothetical protein [Rhodococcus qingshengii]
MTAPDPGLCEYCRLLTTTGWGGPDCCETCASHAPGLTECTCPTINAEGLTAPDPGLTDLIAAALYSVLAKAAKSGTATVDDLVASVTPVVEQHTNGRIAPVLEDFDWHIQNASNGAVFAAEAEDGQGLISWQNEMGIYQRAARLLRTALEGES